MYRLAATVALVLGMLCAAPAQAQPQPDERREMTLQQRLQFWRSLGREEKGRTMRELPPEQRDALRERMIEERQGRAPDGGPRRLSPEERQQLRNQIYETNRDWDFRNQLRDSRDFRRDDARDGRRDDRRDDRGSQRRGRDR